MLHSRSGRASIAVLGAILAIAGGSVALSTRARAQSTNPPTMSETFGPQILTPASDRTNEGGDHILIGLLLPAVQKSRLGFRVQFLNSDLNVMLPLISPETGKATVLVDVYESVDAKGNRFLHIKSQQNEEEIVRRTADSTITFRALPAVQDTGNVMPIASSATFISHRNVAFGDGSVVPMPVQYPINGIIAVLIG